MTLCSSPSPPGGGATSVGAAGCGSASAITGFAITVAPTTPAAAITSHTCLAELMTADFTGFWHVRAISLAGGVVAITRKSTGSAVLLPRPAPGKSYPVTGQPAVQVVIVVGQSVDR